MNERDIPHARDEVKTWMYSIEQEPAHTLQVARLALQVFDQLQPLHGHGAIPRFYLEAASMLHDVGWTAVRDGKGHHKHSARMIREQSWKHLDPHEVAVVGVIARYHRKALPSIEHPEFEALDANQRRLVECLASMLRLADGLDRAHLQRVDRVTLTVLPLRLRVQLISEALELKAELAAARKKGDLLRIHFGRALEIHLD